MTEEQEVTELDISAKLGEAFDKIIESKFGHLIAPPPVVTPLGIAPLDALLGGGIVSSGPVLFSSTPETGKSTIAYQFSKSFLSYYDTGVVLYVDIETSGNVENSQFRVNRVDQFGLDRQRFKYQPVVVNLLEFFEMIEHLIQVKKTFEEKLDKEFFVAIIWDSIASTRCSKTDAAENPDKIIGVKARQLSFGLDKYTPMIKFNKVTFIGIDQVRADMKIDGPYVSNERSVGTFKNLKSATNVYALQH